MNAKGKKSFVLRTGVIGWGGLMFAVMTLTGLHKSPRHNAIDYVFEVGLNLLIWPLAGFFLGRSMWDFYETWFTEDPEDPQIDR